MSKARKFSNSQRRKLAEMPLKKKAFLKLVDGDKKILEVLKKEGPLTRGQIMKLTGIPSGTVDRYLYVIIALECIERVGRKYVRHSDTYIYENKADRDLVLDHSKFVASGLLHLIQPEGRYHIKDELMPNEEYVEEALSHLKSAPEYRKIYSNFKEAKKAKREEKYYSAWQLFEESVKQLIKQVLNKTPLAGKCLICPRVITLPKEALDLYIQHIKEKKVA